MAENNVPSAIGLNSSATDALKYDILLALDLSDAQGRFREFRQAV